MRLAALSVDLDEIPCYAAIHGLASPPETARWAIYERALPRFVDLFAELGVPATFFAVGRDAMEAPAADALARLRRAGHEIGNHSHDHLYDFSRRDAATIAAQIDQANDAIEAATGARPRGFRAPGYTIHEGVFEALAQGGMTYDSSVFPCPAYYGAKTAAIGWIAARGRHSHSVVDAPRVLLAPADPYRVGGRYHRRGAGIVELPIGVTRLARLPYIGTSLVVGGPLAARFLTRGMLGRPLVNLELHGIDLADAESDGLAFLRPHQPDLRQPLATKRAALVAAITSLREAGYRFVTLAEAADAFTRRAA